MKNVLEDSLLDFLLINIFLIGKNNKSWKNGNVREIFSNFYEAVKDFSETSYYNQNYLRENLRAILKVLEEIKNR